MEVFSAQEADGAERVIDALGYLNGLVRSVHGSDAFLLCDAAKTGMNVYQKGIVAPAEGGIQTHLLYRAVREDAIAQGVEIYEGIRVSGWEDTSVGVEVSLAQGGVIRASRMLICTNGFTRDLIPTVAVAPARGQVFVTESLRSLPFQGIYHADQGYIYFRSLGDRLLIGGGRNRDFVGEETMDMDVTKPFEQYLKTYVETVILPGKSVRFEYGWSGIMGMDKNRNPLIGWHSDHVCLAVRMGGMGVALSAWVAEEVLNVVRDDKGI
jgi:glycine/D-amino acid oxidase-like deaminating enzyme